ncbi:hypothetical protein EYR41_007546 [Orbilia oligospora]|uniref:Uncharacterized protein n=1 Tax=Orbilia oligospora TaxID=2813651 RepID=A0A7C8U609_ORBOL|nr:hypothetical protein TWF751_008390 [Orbilia oligospora]KAF3296175.1 hypothetical protein TWF132_011637 [Orbilia oligospora]TGJ68500.1 hypothetical protein EYR41_007546 [Orbilia oligospora]
MPSAITYKSTSSSNRYFPDTQNIMSFVLSTLDRIASPETRQRAYNTVFRFCYQRPILSSFLGVQLLFAFVPLLCFIGFSVSAILFLSALALGAGLFWVLVAGVVLFWALVITFTLAAATWVYLAVCFVSIRKVGRATGYIETPGSQRSRPTKTSTSTSSSSLQNGKADTVNSDEKVNGDGGFEEKEEPVKEEGPVKEEEPVKEGEVVKQEE